MMAKPKADHPAADRVTATKLASALKAIYANATDDEQTDDSGTDDRDMSDVDQNVESPTFQPRKPAAIQVPRLTAAEQKELDMLQGMISPDWDQLDDTERIHKRARMHLLETRMDAPFTREDKGKWVERVSRHVADDVLDDDDLATHVGSMDTALVRDDHAAINSFCEILSTGLRCGGTLTSHLVEGQVKILKHVANKLANVTTDAELANIKVQQLIDNEFTNLRQHVADLEAKCVTEDFQGLQSRIDGIVEDVATWKAEHGLVEAQIEALQDTSRSLYDQGKAHDEEMGKLKARVDDLESLADRHEKFIESDTPEMKIQHIVDGKLQGFQDEFKVLAKNHNAMRRALVNVGVLTADGKLQGHDAIIPTDRLRNLETGLDELKNNRAARDDVKALTTRLDNLQTVLDRLTTGLSAGGRHDSEAESSFGGFDSGHERVNDEPDDEDSDHQRPASDGKRSKRKRPRKRSQQREDAE